jgi:hypothetical protein
MRIDQLVRGNLLAGALLAAGLAPQGEASTLYKYKGNPMIDCFGYTCPATPPVITMNFTVAAPLEDCLASPASSCS